MTREDRLKRVQGAGADFLDTARARAEEFLRELAKATGDSQGRAQGAIDDLVVGGRKSTEQFVSTIRKEVQNQLGALGLATKADLAALERKLSGKAPAAAKSTAATKSTTATRSTTAGKTTATKTAAKKTAATKAPAKKAPAKKAAG
jgi:polyhydroxyalkanoate synthesis regulator phasin